MAERSELNVGHLFLGGIIAAAGAFVFTKIVGACGSKSCERQQEEDDIDAILVAAAASDTD